MFITCDWVLVLVRLLLNDLHKILHDISPPLVDDDRCCQVSEEVLRICLDGIEIPADQC